MSGPSDRTYAIHPALGIARLGNAAADPADPSTYYLGAESPYQVPNEGQPYKIGGKIKQQAQRFRIYEYEGGQPTREITLTQTDVKAIEWTVHVANRKAALNIDLAPGSISTPVVVPPKLWGMNTTPPDNGNPHYWPAATRNASVVEHRAQLCIDPGPQSVGRTVSATDLSGTITLASAAGPASKTVALGKLCTEANTGRLLVFGGSGISEGLDDKGQFSPLPTINDFGNNDNWYDDTADGWVQATITFSDGSTLTLDQPEQRAWVITASPRYVPGVNNFTTLYDAAVNAVCSPRDLVARASFARDVYPILRCASLQQWVSVRATAGHSDGKGGDYLTQDRMRLVSDNNPSPESDPYRARTGVFNKIRNPHVDIVEGTVQSFMPQVSADITNNPTHCYDIAAVTPLQYAKLQQWSVGNFDFDGVPQYVPLDSMDVKLQPNALDRAALEGTTGTPFYPGIESWRIMRPADLYAGSSVLRMNAATQPGDLTIGNALPWQADFLDCNDNWWPIQRPNEVTRDLVSLQSWVPDAWIPNGNAIYNAMVTGWSQLGFVVTQDNGDTYIEVEGTAQDGPNA